MPSAPTVCVVVPAYNHERFVAEAVASVLAQSWRDLELIVVDDGSRDATADAARQAAGEDPRARVIEQENRGSHGAINRGIAESRAPWIAILNSDDRYAPPRIERMLAFAGDRYDFVVSDARLVDAEGAEIVDPAHWWLRTIADFQAKADALGAFEGLLYGNYTVSTSNFVFRRDLFEAIGPLRRLRHVIDWEYALRAAQSAPERFGYLRGERLFDYRLHGGNAILADTLRGALEMKRVQGEALERIGVPHALVASLHRAHRDLRRAARDQGYRAGESVARSAVERADELAGALAAAERFVREREADVAELSDELRRVRESLAWRVLSRLGLTGTR